MDDYFFPIIDENINPCRGCPDYGEDGCKSNAGCSRPPTNADRIRAMTDEELADELSYLGCHKQSSREICLKHTGDCIQCWIDWMKQEVQE
jgi:hypothetical protein